MYKMDNIKLYSGLKVSNRSGFIANNNNNTVTYKNDLKIIKKLNQYYN